MVDLTCTKMLECDYIPMYRRCAFGRNASRFLWDAARYEKTLEVHCRCDSERFLEAEAFLRYRLQHQSVGTHHRRYDEGKLAA